MLKQKESSPRQTAAAVDAVVLIVDDSRTVVHAIKGMLEGAGYHTDAAFDGVQAVHAAKTRRVDLILMDIVMPHMNGFEATRLLAADPKTASIPVVIVSGTDQATDRAWGTRVGAKGFLAKPVQRDLLVRTVQTVLEQSWRDTARQLADRQFRDKGIER
jgi:twitching motility two-component system response regulator PilH